MIAAVTMARDEADIIAATVTHLYNHGVDLVIVADNLSTDCTQAEAARAGAEILEDLDPAYRQADKMTGLAHLAMDEGADWIIPFDADELWYPPTGTLKDFLNSTDLDVVECFGWDHIATHHDEPGHPFTSITHRRLVRQPLPKVAFRSHPMARLEMGNHDVHRPGRRGVGLKLRHFQYRSLEQMIRKVRQGCAAYRETNLGPEYGAHWRALDQLSDEQLEEHWDRLCKEPDLLYDPAPLRTA